MRGGLDTPSNPIDGEQLLVYLEGLKSPGDIVLPDNEKIKYDAKDFIVDDDKHLNPRHPGFALSSNTKSPEKSAGQLGSMIIIPIPGVNILQSNIPGTDAGKGKISTSDYATLSYNQIKSKGNNNASITQPEPDFRLSIDTTKRTIKYIDNKSIAVYIKNKGTVQDRSPLKATLDANKSDFVTLFFKPLAPNADGKRNGVSFRSYITSFSDNWSVGYDETTIVNDSAAITAYKTTARGGSIAFKVPALSKSDMGTIYGKLQSLVRIAVLPKQVTSADGKIATQAPFTEFTLGGWFNSLPIAISSLKYDVQLAEYAWDLDTQRPQIVDVSMDFKVVIGIGDATAATPIAGYVPFI